jgi:XRE family transcriptional regulator, master regulator for biofilm formation
MVGRTRVGVVLKALREDKEMTQIELSKKAKVAQSYIAMLEGSEKKNPSLAILNRLAKALGVSVSELLE